MNVLIALISGQYNDAAVGIVFPDSADRLDLPLISGSRRSISVISGRWPPVEFDRFPPGHGLRHYGHVRLRADNGRDAENAPRDGRPPPSHGSCLRSCLHLAGQRELRDDSCCLAPGWLIRHRRASQLLDPFQQSRRRP